MMRTGRPRTRERSVDIAQRLLDLEKAADFTEEIMASRRFMHKLEALIPIGKAMKILTTEK